MYSRCLTAQVKVVQQLGDLVRIGVVELVQSIWFVPPISCSSRSGLVTSTTGLT